LLSSCRARLRYSLIATEIFDGPACFDGLKYGDDLVFSESGFAHGDLLRGHNQYVGRSLKVNGSDYWDTYTSSNKERSELQKMVTWAEMRPGSKSVVIY
jgi:hypothetical protein